MPTPEELAPVREAILAGDPQKADDLLAGIIEREKVAAAAAAGKPAEPPPPRHRDVILYDFLATLTGLHGSNSRLEMLMQEWATVVLPNQKL